MKRSDGIMNIPPNGKKIYWRPNRFGYTDDVKQAGYYTALELDDCCGYGWDWIAERVKFQ